MKTGEISFINKENKEIILKEKLHEDCVNSVRLFEKGSKTYCLSAAGQRHYKIGDSDSETDSDEESSDDEIDM